MGRLKITRLCQRCESPFHPWSGNHPGYFCSVQCREVPAVARFWAKVVKTDGCWEWAGRVDKDGYGEFYPILAHRFSYELHYGPIPKGKWVLHKCDNPPCTKPDHLYLGTNVENVGDRTVRGRQRGELHGMAIVTEQEVKEIRERYQQGGISQTRLGAEYGLTQTGVSQIITYRSWKHVA